MTLTIRQRLTLWYTVAAAALLLTLGASLTIVHQRVSLSRLDLELRRLNDALGTVLATEVLEHGDRASAAEEALIEVVVPGRHLAILDGAGTVMAQRWTLPSPPSLRLAGSFDAASTIAAPMRARVVARSAPPVPGGFTILTAASWDELNADRDDLVRALLILIPLALIATASGAWWVAGRALTPAAAMAAEAQRLTEHSTGGRLTVGRLDELGRLATAFNGLVDRLESALAMRRQFLADASHELRTPVSVARTAADVALGRAERTSDEYRDALTTVSEQMKYLGRIVSDMLTMARSDTADWPLAPTDFYFDELLADAVRAISVLSADRGVAIETDCPADLQVRGDEELLRQMVVNLLENAVRHTPSGGAVRAAITVTPTGLRLTIQDTGHGIADGDRERIFDRFVHVAAPGAPGARDSGGTGLGLAIARRIARAHRGDLTLESTGPGGTRFAVTLPAVRDLASST